MAALDDLPVLPCAAREAWAAWRGQSRASQARAWSTLAKKATGIPTDFAMLDSQNGYAIVHRIAGLVEMPAAGERPHPQRDR